MKLISTRISFLYAILIIAPSLSASFVPVTYVTTEEYVVDPKESVITWKCSMQFVPQNRHVGHVYISKGELMIEKGVLVGGTVDVDMNTIEDEVHGSDNNLIDHIKSPDFFDVKKFPTSTLTITKVGSANDGNINVTGNLTIKGITHEINLPVKLEVNAGVVNASGEVIIDRTKWDVRYNSGKFFDNLADETISDDIELDVKIVARKK
ncbi:MAG: YceI family protein [Bacteroidota bacterium]